MADLSFECFTQGPIVTILVGHDKVPFQAHEGVMTECAFFKEAHTRVINMPEDDATLFHHLLFWLYRGTLPVELKNTLPERDLEDKLSTLTQLWVLADKLMLPKLQDCITSQICSLFRSGEDFVSKAILEWTWQHTTTGSKLRKLLVRINALITNQKAYQQLLPSESDTAEGLAIKTEMVAMMLVDAQSQREKVAKETTRRLTTYAGNLGRATQYFANIVPSSWTPPNLLAFLVSGAGSDEMKERKAKRQLPSDE